MDKSWIIRRMSSWLAAAALVPAMACGDGGSSVPAAEVFSPRSGAELLESVRPRMASMKPVSPAEFNHRFTRSDLGVAHNMLLKQFLAEFAVRGRDRCEIMERLWLEGTFDSTLSKPLGPAERARQIPFIRRELKCDVRRAELVLPDVATSHGVFLARASLSAAQRGSAETYVQALELAIDEAHDPTDVATAAVALLESAATQLSPEQYAVFEGSAGIYVNSADYWHPNVTVEYMNLEPAIEDNCFDTLGSPQQCEFYDVKGRPSGRGQPATIRYASFGGVSGSVGCLDLLHWTNFAKVDGAVGFVALVASGGNAGAAIAAGTAASATSFIAAAVAFFWCLAAS